MTTLRHPAAQFFAVLAAVLVAHLATARQSEPYFNNDEIRHTMTGVFVADAIRDLPASAADPKGYAVRYYCQYPGLGVVYWPPLFYAVEGLAMLALGPHFWVGRVCVAGFAAVALVYTYLFALNDLTPRPHSAVSPTRERGTSETSPPARSARHPLSEPERGRRTTPSTLEGVASGASRGRSLPLLAVALVALTPVVFVYSQRVMLEVPTFALLMAAVVHFEQYLRAGRGRDAMIACLAAAGAALTRFDGVLLAVYFGLRLLTTRRWAVLLNRPVLFGVLLAVALTLPYYVFTWAVYPGVGVGTHPDSNALSPLQRWTYYLTTLPDQAGWPLAVVAVGGLVVTIARDRRRSGPTFALLAATFLFFAPLSELEFRHGIYWLPAVAVLACRLVRAAGKWGPVLAVGLLAGGVWEVTGQAYRYVFGYEDAARWVLAHRTTDRPVLVDGEFTTSLVYHVRKHDPARRVWVLRGDKLLYAVFSDPTTGYKPFARTPAEVLDRLEKYDPEFVVVEDPPPDFHVVEGVELLLATLKANPDRYVVEVTIPVRSNYDRFTAPGTCLLVYRKLHRNPNAATAVEIEVLGLGQTLGARSR